MSQQIYFSEKLIKSSHRKRKTTQLLGSILIWLCSAIVIATVIWVIGYVLANGLPQVTLEFLTTRPKGGVSGEGGMSTTIVTTLYLVILTIVFATPIGVFSAIYLVEYAGEISKKSKLIKHLITIIRTGVEILSGVPSIIFGLFGFALFVVYMKFSFSLLSASLSGACLILPTIIRTTEEALKAVPRSFREGSLSLGATKWHTIQNIVLPAASPGIITGIVLGVGRIIAETAIFWVTLGGSYRLPSDVMSAGRSMALHVYMLASETRAFDKAMGTASVLIIVIILLNLAINLTSSRLNKRFQGR